MFTPNRKKICYDSHRNYYECSRSDTYKESVSETRGQTSQAMA